jgi:hypothetical protein
MNEQATNTIIGDYERGYKDGYNMVIKQKKVVAATSNENYLFRVYDDGSYDTIKL